MDNGITGNSCASLNNSSNSTSPGQLPGLHAGGAIHLASFYELTNLRPFSSLSLSCFAFGYSGISGDMVVRGRGLDVAVDPTQIIDHLDWPTKSTASQSRPSHEDVCRGRVERCETATIPPPCFD